jgi:cell shape-determining protein MreC
MALSNYRVVENLKVIAMLERQLVLIKPWTQHKSFEDDYGENERYKATMGMLKKLRWLEKSVGNDNRDYTDLLDINADQTTMEMM